MDKHILIVDDHLLSCKVIEERIKQNKPNYKIEAVTTVIEAEKRILELKELIVVAIIDLKVDPIPQNYQGKYAGIGLIKFIFDNCPKTTIIPYSGFSLLDEEIKNELNIYFNRVVIDKLENMYINKNNHNALQHILSKIKSCDSGCGVFHALLIAVQEYKEKKIKNLRNPINDAKRLKDVLNKCYRFDEENIIFLQNPTRKDIFQELHNFREKLTIDDNLLIFYAGHGKWDYDVKQGYWLPSTAEIINSSEWVSNSDLKDQIAAMKARHILTISDACFSGSLILEEATRGEDPSYAVQTICSYQSRSAMTSGRMEEVSDNSPLLQYLCEFLENNKEQCLPANTIYNMIIKDVFKVGHIIGTDQKPIHLPIKGTKHRHPGDFIFLKR